MKAPNDAQLAYALLRFGFGVTFAMHGVNRLVGGLGRFASKTVEDFSSTWLPRALVWPFGWALPFVELAIGSLLVIGAWTPAALVVGALVMTALMFGTAVRGDWSLLGIQLLYALTFYLLLARHADDCLGVDALVRK